MDTGTFAYTIFTGPDGNDEHVIEDGESIGPHLPGDLQRGKVQVHLHIVLKKKIVYVLEVAESPLAVEKSSCEGGVVATAITTATTTTIPPTTTPGRIHSHLGPSRLRPVGDGGSRAGNWRGINGQTQFWQFLLDILCDAQHKDIIEWVPVNGIYDGTFRLINSQRVAELWGRLKRTPSMTVEHMGRNFRLYYGGDMINRSTEGHYHYKFVYDIALLNVEGYDLNEIVRRRNLNLPKPHIRKP